MLRMPFICLLMDSFEGSQNSSHHCSMLYKATFPPSLMNQAKGKYNNDTSSSVMSFSGDNWRCPDKAEFPTRTCKQASRSDQHPRCALDGTRKAERPCGRRNHFKSTKGNGIKAGQTLIMLLANVM